MACEKGYHSRSLLLKSATLVAVDCDDHALAKGLAIMGGNIVGRFASGIYTFRSACRLWFASTLMALDASRSPRAM